MCRKTDTNKGCPAGELLKDKNTCVKKEMCPCLKPDGTVAQVCFKFEEIVRKYFEIPYFFAVSLVS